MRKFKLGDPVVGSITVGNHKTSFFKDGERLQYYTSRDSIPCPTEPVLVDVEKRVRINKGIYSVNGSPSPNATLRGKARDGKPVGQWTIDMDAD